MVSYSSLADVSKTSEDMQKLDKHWERLDLHPAAPFPRDCDPHL